jgi:hypothetical protein
MRKTKHRGIGRVTADFLLNLIAYNLIRIPNWSRRSQPGVWIQTLPTPSHRSNNEPRQKENPQFPSFSASC